MATTKTHTQATAATVVTNGVKAIAEIGVVPGASLLADGEVRSGTLHILSGVVARALFGPIGWLAVGADSFSRSVSGKHIYEHFFDVDVDVKKARD
ncbi:MAG TPA: DUF6072 family protein [Thermoanaerobaculia bacterium]|nr:DUF6072 family protein [Thermoanaerobaculia bacterium]